MYFYITAGVGLVLLGGAAYHYKEADQIDTESAEGRAVRYGQCPRFVAKVG